VEAIAVEGETVISAPPLYLIAHYHDRPSEVWLHRLRESLGNQVRGEAYFDTGKNPAVPPLCLTPLYWKILLRTGWVSDWKYAPPRTSALKQSIARSESKLVYCHFANLAIRLMSVWDAIEHPVVVHCHGFDIAFDLLDANGRPRYTQRYRDDLVRLSKRVHLIANSEFSRQRLLSIGVADSRISVWHFGVPASQVCHVDNADPIQILFLGRFIGCKGPLETVQAFKLLRERGFEANMTMAGDGPLRMRCQSLSRELGMEDCIKFPGAVDRDEVGRLMVESNLFTAHTQQDPVTRQCEAFGVAFAEALASGLPVVTGNHAGPSTFLTHEHDALLFAPGNVEQHADYLQRLVEDSELRRRLSHQAQLTATERFDMDRQMSVLVDLLSRTVKASR